MSKKYIFSELDYKSGDGMMTSVWGPPMWHVLHTISFNYPIKPTAEQKKHYFNFYNGLVFILPCKYCRDNLTNNFINLPLTMDVFKNRNSLSRYIYQLHENINTMLNKKSGLSYEDVRDRYEYFRSRCLEDPISISINPIVKIEKGCTEPLYGVKSKCILNIVPKDDSIESFKMDPKCILKKIPTKSSKSSKKSSKSSVKKSSKSSVKKSSKSSVKKSSVKKSSVKKSSKSSVKK
jgi:hypothetical protein